MNKVLISSILLAATMFFHSCGEPAKEKETKEEKDKKEQEDKQLKEEKKAGEEQGAATAKIMENNGIKLVEVVGSPEFPYSSLKINQPDGEETLEKGNVDFKFKVAGGRYKLQAQTEDVQAKKCANSSKGQHIHLIIDNNPYEAVYEEEYTTAAKLEPGNHVALAFISRSYHESLKHKEAYDVVQFQVGDKKEDDIDLEAPHMIYSRPKGEYSLSDASKVFVDFYLLNAELAEDGHYVECTINDEATFKITKWAPFYMEGLPLGENTISLKLMDADDNFVEGPFNAVERTFTILE